MTAPAPSNRQFGLVFVIFFALLAAFSAWRGGDWFVGLAVASLTVGLVTLVVPRVLTPFNRAWMKLAAVLHRIFSPVVLGIMFFAVITPVGLIARRCRRDPLRRRREPDAPSYWIEREPPGPPPGSLDKQY
jgi:hypothetical protein